MSKMLSIAPSNACDNNIISTPMDIADENCNDSCATASEGHTSIHLKAKTTLTDVSKSDQRESEMFPCDKSLMSKGYMATPTEDDDKTDKLQEQNNNNSKSLNANIVRDPPNDDNDEDDANADDDPNDDDNDDDDDDEDEIFIDTEEDLVNGDCGLAKLYLNEVEIDREEEEVTITELVNVAENDTMLKVEEAKGMRVAFGVILRLIFPLANGVVQGIKGIRDVRFLRVLRSIASSRQTLNNLFAFAANTISMNLSSVQVSHRLEPILKLLKISKPSVGIESLPDVPSPTTLLPSEVPTTPGIPSAPVSPTPPLLSPFFRQPRPSLPNFQVNRKSIALEDQMAPKCCTLNILAEPPLGQPIRADIVFIHGLHGSLVNTWKQGLWENDRKPEGFERPPKPPVRPPKRPRHSRTAIVHPPHRQKRARFAQCELQPKYRDSLDELEDQDYSFICGEPRDVQVCDGIEYSFPTFRLRMHDNGRQLQAEIDSLLQEARHKEEENKENKGTNKKLKSTKLSPNDPNYSKCWPGDWLPIDCPGVRVIALNYTTDPHLWRPMWRNKEPRSSLTQRAKEMADLLIQHRVGYGHPIVWVGHSKGGLFIKQIIVDAWESGRPAAAPFWRSARGVFFYSVPHRGSHLASIRAPLLTRSVELIDIEKNSKYLADLHRRFTGLYHMGHLKIEVFSFVETALTLMSVLYLRIVGADSADPGIGDVCGIRLDHREICKPRSRDCILYRQLVNMINKVC